MKFKIRRADEKDFKSILELEKKWEKEGISWGVKHPTKKDLMNHIKKDICFVVVSDKKFLGHIIAVIKKSKNFLDYAKIKKGERYGYIDGVFVLPEYRKLGIGKKLVEIVIEHFKKNKLKKIVLKATSKKLKELESFYNKLGFESKFVDMVRKIK